MKPSAVELLALIFSSLFAFFGLWSVIARYSGISGWGKRRHGWEYYHLALSGGAAVIGGIWLLVGAGIIAAPLIVPGLRRDPDVPQYFLIAGLVVGAGGYALIMYLAGVYDNGKR